jgi:hypothetical protein
MLVQAKGLEGQTKFVFYTYDPIGRDVKIPLWAEDSDAAWAKFDRVYGKDTPVDWVEEIK